MMLQRLATGATGMKQARYRRRPTRGSEALARACAVSMLLLNVRPAYEFRRGFCTLVLSLLYVLCISARHLNVAGLVNPKILSYFEVYP